MTEFSDLGLAESLLRAVSAQGYTQPTPIQAAVIPTLLNGRDVLGTAQTGTGKTAAFVLPLLDTIARDNQRAPKGRCRSLILAPTRELAAQIAENVRSYSRFMKCSVAVIVGGAKPGPQRQAMAKGVDVLIATPGRLIDHMGTGAVRLDWTATVVLDEADQMLDMGFLPAIRRILGALPAERQTALLSATMPKDIRKLAHEALSAPQEISMAPVSRPIEQITQTALFLEPADKLHALVEILGAEDVARSVVFTRTKRGADKLVKRLQSAQVDAFALHGNKSQAQRTKALNAFRKGSTRILVATDIAARGIDVDDVSHVVNFDIPEVPETYVHRIGRTARAGRSGMAVSLCADAERGLLRDIERHIEMAFGEDGLAEPATFQPKGKSGPKAKSGSKGTSGRAPARRRPGGRPDAHTEGDKPPARRRRRKPAGQDQGQAKAKPKAAGNRQTKRPSQEGRDGDSSGLMRMLGA